MPAKAARRSRFALALPFAALLPGAASALGLVVPPGAVFSLGDGAVELGCTDLQVQAAALVQAGAGRLGFRHLSLQGTLAGGAALLEVTGDWSNQGTFSAGAGTVRFTDGCVATAMLTGGTVFNHLSFASGTGKTFLVQAGATQRVTGLLTVQSPPSLPLNLSSTAPGQTASIQVSGSLPPILAQVTDVIFLGGDSGPSPTPRSIPTLTPGALALLGLALAWLGRRRLRRPPTHRV